MVKRQVCRDAVDEGHRPGLTSELKNDEPSAFTKNKKANKRSSKVIELLGDQPVAALTGSAQVDEPVGGGENDEPPINGRQRGAKSFTIAELTLLNKCMEAAVPIGQQGVMEAIRLYNRVATDKRWVVRGDKALQQKWDKVRTYERLFFFFF
jgi:hypothetical protein